MYVLPGGSEPEETVTATPVPLLDDATVLVFSGGAVATADVAVDVGSAVDTATADGDVVGTADDVVADSGGTAGAAGVAAVDSDAAV